MQTEKAGPGTFSSVYIVAVNAFKCLMNDYAQSGKKKQFAQNQKFMVLINLHWV